MLNTIVFLETICTNGFKLISKNTILCEKYQAKHVEKKVASFDAQMFRFSWGVRMYLGT